MLNNEFPPLGGGTGTVNQAILKQLIVDSLGLEGVNPDDIGDHDPLFGGELNLDSVDALEIVVALEKALGVKIRSQEVDPKVFATVASMIDYLEERAAREGGVPG